MIWLEYRTEDGLIVNAIVYDGEEPYTPPDGLLLVERGDSEAWMGWTYDGEIFTPPEEPTDETAPDETDAVPVDTPSE